MSVPAAIPPARRPELLLRPAPEHNGFVVHDPRTQDQFRLGPQEAFLLARLDGQHSPAHICATFAAKFGQPLAEVDLREFLDLARATGFLQNDRPSGAADVLEHIAEYEEEYADSETIYRRAEQVIAGASTHDRRGFGPFPVYVERAHRARKWAVGGKLLIDYWMGHGALLMGHGFPPVIEAIRRQAERGTHYGAGHDLEVRWAELVNRLVPSAERVRFTSSGTEATQLALRVARAYTGRPLIVKFHGHFHGWHDEAMAHFYATEEAGFSPSAMAGGAVANSVETVAAILAQGHGAGVLLEPGGGSSGALPWNADTLRALRELTTKHGSLLIFDEVISGFRQSPGGVQAVTGVLPDITTLAKILSGGLPGGAVVGRAEVMAVFGQGQRVGGRWAQVPHTGTFNGNPLSAAAGIALLEHIADGVPQQRALAAAEELSRRINQVAEQHRVDVHSYTNGCSVVHLLIGGKTAGLSLGPSHDGHLLYHSHPERYAMLRRALLLEGVDFPPLHGWVSAVHDAQTIAETGEAFARAFGRLCRVDGFRLDNTVSVVSVVEVQPCRSN